MPTGVSIPPPTPWRIRKATSSVMLAARPHSADATVNTTIAASRTRLPPKRSPSQPEAGMNTARLTRKAIETLLTEVGGDVEVAPDRGERHVDDRRVHDRHEHRRDEDHGDGDLLAQMGAAWAPGQPTGGPPRS